MLKKILIGLGIGLVLIVGILVVLMIQSNTPLTKAEAEAHLNSYFSKVAEKAGKDNFSGVQVSIFSKGKDIDWHYAGGSGARLDALTAQTPFHVASVGKLMTATLIYQYMDAGKLRLDQPISEVLPKAMLDGLFVYDGKDYQTEVTFEQLLAHTSGVPDYFGGPVVSGDSMSTLLKAEPNKLWTPDELLDFSRNHQVAVNAPGKGYHYSDTGYVLLGKAVETISGNSFESELASRIFEPLVMRDTYMALRQLPLNGEKPPIADLWLNGSELGSTNSLSVDWAGGGLISTLEDLTKFSQALHGGKLMSDKAYQAMFSDTHVFEQGIYTGTGGMTIHFEKFFPLLKLPTVNGHIGVLATHVFYDTATDTHIVMNFGSTDKMVDSFMALIEIMRTIGRVQ